MAVQKLTLVLNSTEDNAINRLTDALRNGFGGSLLSSIIEEIHPAFKLFTFDDGSKVPYKTALSGATAIKSLIDDGIYALDSLADLEDEYEISEEEFETLRATMVRTYGFIPTGSENTYACVWYSEDGTPIWIETTTKRPENEGEVALVAENLYRTAPDNLSFADRKVIAIDDVSMPELHAIVRPFDLIPESGSWTYYLLKDGEEIVGTMSTKKMLKHDGEVKAYALHLGKPECETITECDLNAYKSAKEGVTYGEKKFYNVKFTSEVKYGSTESNSLRIRSKYALDEATHEWVLSHLSAHLSNFELGEASIESVEIHEEQG